MSTPRKHHDPERAEARRCQVLDAATACFARSGFHGASMAEIAREAGMSAGHIYNYFASKEEIIFGIVDRNVAHKLALMQGLIEDPEKDVLEAMLGRVATSICDNSDAHYAALMMEVAAESSRNPAVAAKVHEADRILSTRFNELLMTSTQLVAYRNDPAWAGRLNMVIVLFEGLRLRALSNPQLDRAQLVEPMRRAIRAILAG